MSEMQNLGILLASLTALVAALLRYCYPFGFNVVELRRNVFAFNEAGVVIREPPFPKDGRWYLRFFPGFHSRVMTTWAKRPPTERELKRYEYECAQIERMFENMISGRVQ